MNTTLISSFLPDLSGLSNLVDLTQPLQAAAITGLALATLGGAYLKFDKQDFLESAIEKDSPMRVRLALMVGADPNANPSWQPSCLANAVLNKQLKVAEVLVQNGALGISSNDRRFLQSLLQRDISFESLEFVIKNEKKTGHSYNQGPHSFLTYQSFINHCLCTTYIPNDISEKTYKKIDLLIKERASIYHTLLQKGNPEFLEWVLKTEKDAGRLNQKTLDSFLHEICADANINFDQSTLKKMEFLIREGADVNSPSPDKFKGNYTDGPCLAKIFHHPLSDSNSIETFKFLLKNGADPNAPDARGQRPLHLVFKCSFSSPILTDLLLEAGAYPGFTNKKEQMPLHMICGGIPQIYNVDREIQIVQSIINHIRRISKPSNLMTPIHEREFGISAKRALTLPALIDAVDKKGKTPLHYAFKNPSKQLVTLLLDAGAHILPDNNGVTPIDLAQNHPEILKIFQDRGLEPVKK